MNTGYIFFLYVLNQTLYLNIPKNIEECYANINYDGFKYRNDSWPNLWNRMNLNFNTQPPTCSIKLKNSTENIIEGKFKYYSYNHTFYSSDWLRIHDISKSCLTDNNEYYIYVILFLCIIILCVIYLIYVIKKNINLCVINK